MVAAGPGIWTDQAAEELALQLEGNRLPSVAHSPELTLPTVVLEGATGEHAKGNNRGGGGQDG